MWPLKIPPLAKYIALAAIVFVVIGYIHSLRADLAAEKAKYDDMTTKMQFYAAQVAQQNQQIVELKKLSDAQKMRVVQAEKVRTQIVTKYVPIIRHIHDAPVPSTCQGAMQWQKQQMQSLLQGW